MFGKDKEVKKVDRKDEAVIPKNERPEFKKPLHPNVSKMLKDQEIKRDVMQERSNLVTSEFGSTNFSESGEASTAGYSQNINNGSIQPDGLPVVNKSDSDDPTGGEKQAFEEWKKSDDYKRYQAEKKKEEDDIAAANQSGEQLKAKRESEETRVKEMALAKKAKEDAEKAEKKK